MTINSFIRETENLLKKTQIETARLDCEVLIADELNKDRSWICAHDDYLLSKENITSLKRKINKRLKNEPLAYIRGFHEFYGRKFEVDKNVLVPRPESETMIELLLSSVEGIADSVEEFQIVDIGTGSGNLIVTAALELSSILNPQSSISFLGLDISEKALVIARKNAKSHNVKVEFIQSDLLANFYPLYAIPSTLILLANLPYVPEKFQINDAAKHEPKIALFSGKDGLDHFRKLFKQLQTGKFGTPVIITESLIDQHQDLAKIAENTGYQQTTEKDLVQVFTRP